MLAATRALVGRGRTIPPLDPSTISLADFHDVVAKATTEARYGGIQNRADSAMPVSARSSASFQEPSKDRKSVVPAGHTDTTGGVPLVLNDGSIVLDRAGNPMLVPPGVSVDSNIAKGCIMSKWSSEERLAEMLDHFFFGQPMDYQRTFGSGGITPLFNDVNRAYIPFGNFNYGAVAAAAGLSLEQTEIAAGAANLAGGDRSGPHGTNPATLPYIIQGYRAYKDGLVGRQ